MILGVRPEQLAWSTPQALRPAAAPVPSSTSELPGRCSPDVSQRSRPRRGHTFLVALSPPGDDGASTRPQGA